MEVKEYKASITHIPSDHLPLFGWHKWSNCWSSRSSKAVSLLSHHRNRAMKQFQVHHKSVHSHGEGVQCARLSCPFCVLRKCSSSPGSHPTENRTCSNDLWDGFVRWGFFSQLFRASNSWQSPYRLPNILVQYCIPLYILCTHVYPCNTVYPVYPYIPCVPMFTRVILYTLYTPIYLVHPCLP